MRGAGDGMADKSVIDEISDRLSQNLRRTNELRNTFDRLNLGKGRASVVETDLLRAAVVLVHAALEDVVRSIEEARLPAIPGVKWNFAVPSEPHDRIEKITMQQLLEYRGKTVEEVFQAAVRQHFERSNYNNLSDLTTALRRVGVQAAVVTTHGGTLTAMMKRRHWIVHRADRNPRTGQGQHHAQHITSATVAEWSRAVSSVGHGLIAEWRKL